MRDVPTIAYPGAAASASSAQISGKLQQAMALQQAGELVRARALYDEILQTHPNNFDALFWLGLMAAQANHLQEAQQLIARAIEINPDHAAANANLGTVLAELERWDEALASYARAIALKPDYAVAYSNQGNALRKLKRPEAALASYEQAIALKPDFAEAYCNRGNVLRELGQWDAALANCDRAIELRPDFADAYCNRGIVQKELGLLDAALASYDRAIAIRPDHAAAYCNRGIALQELDRIDAALASYNRAIAIKADFPEAYYNRSIASLSLGDFENGWIDYEWRWRTEHGARLRDRRMFREGQWLGRESLAGKTILLHCEQGLGDTLQFCRYVRPIAALGARVILEVQGPLRSVLAGLDGVSQLVVQGDALPAFDYHCALMSLPLAFKTTTSSVPARVPYLEASAQKVQHWKERLGEKMRLRVGLVWSGGFRPDQPELWSVNHRRNIPLAKLAALKHPDIEFYSLQKGQPAESEATALLSTNWDGPHLTDLTRLLNDFSDTAALMELLDLVISVDTSIAHLAGAMGKPVWILNRFDSCWRWMHDRSDTPWYPTATLYRQEKAGDWDGVVQRVRADLRSYR